VNDVLRSIIQTQHPDLAKQVKDAIHTMQVVLEMADPAQLRAAQGAIASPDAPTDVPDIMQTRVLEPGNISATSDAQFSIAAEQQKRRHEGPLQLAAGDAFGRYQIIKPLGRGAMGAVYLAYDPRLERHVAIKIPFVRDNPIALERFYIEARATATLRSPNICPIYDVEQINGVHYIAMAFIDGEPLSKVIEAGAIEPRTIGEIISKTARGIQKAHEKGIVHRDIKPDNIMIEEGGEPVVMDFGLALRGDNEDARLTHDGAVLGSPAYMSPEQARGDQQAVGPHSDIYSLGVVLYHALTQKLPFEGPVMSVLQRIIFENPQPPSARRPELAGHAIEQVCMKMMAKAPADRYSSMADVANAVDECFVSGQAKKTRTEKRGFWPFRSKQA